jgi:hypothetical protein
MKERGLRLFEVLCEWKPQTFLLILLFAKILQKYHPQMVFARICLRVWQERYR